MSYSRDEEEYLELHREKEVLLGEHPVASERSENTKRQIKKICDRMRKISRRLDEDVENISTPKAAKTARERKREQRMRMSNSKRRQENEGDRKRKRLPRGKDDTSEAVRYLHVSKCFANWFFPRNRSSSSRGNDETSDGESIHCSLGTSEKEADEPVQPT